MSRSLIGLLYFHVIIYPISISSYFFYTVISIASRNSFLYKIWTCQSKEVQWRFFGSSAVLLLKELFVPPVRTCRRNQRRLLPYRHPAIPISINRSALLLITSLLDISYVIKTVRLCSVLTWLISRNICEFFWYRFLPHLQQEQQSLRQQHETLQLTCTLCSLDVSVGSVCVPL
jgi:hypothetical protein